VRILSLGQGLPDAAIDNFNWASALSFYDYDAIIVDPLEAVSRLIDGVVRDGTGFFTYHDEPITDGPSTSESVGLADLLRRRRLETERLLARGGLVVCFGYPDLPHPNVSGFTGCHRYYWLPAPTGTDFGPNYIKAAGGRNISVTDFEHPFANYLDSRRSDVLYRAWFSEGSAGFPGSKVLARSDGGTAIAMDLPVGEGRIIFLPALPSRISSGERSGLASRLVTAIRNTLLSSAEGSPPVWLEQYSLPGIDALNRRIEDAEARLDEVEAELHEARSEYLGIDRYRRLLWQEGKYGFELPVRDALTLLGFTQYSNLDDPAVFSFGGHTIFMEADASLEAVGMEPHYRLRQRLEEKIADEGRTPPRAIVVVNGYREQALGERPQQYSDALKVASESMRYCLLQATDLYDAVRYKLEGRGDPQAFLRKLIATEGVFEPDPEPPMPEPEPEPEPEASLQEQPPAAANKMLTEEQALAAESNDETPSDSTATSRIKD
jgi:hypothetical protein